MNKQKNNYISFSSEVKKNDKRRIKYHFRKS